MKRVAFVVGTTAEVIKISEVYKNLATSDHEVFIVSTQQQSSELFETFQALNLPQPHLMLSKNKESLKFKRQVPYWALNSIFSLFKLKKIEPSLILVQGDTLSTLLGALLAKILRIPLGHIEAGLRSGSILSPFPEEITRRIVTKIAELHICPDQLAFNNIKTRNTIKINSNGNTGIDALRNFFNLRIEKRGKDNQIKALTVLHRSELINNKDKFKATLCELNKLALKASVIFMIDSPTREKLIKNFGKDFNENFSNIDFRQKANYFDFTKILFQSDFVITDSGGLQEEAFRLGLPCYIYRNETERSDGLGLNAKVIGMNPNFIPNTAMDWVSLKQSTNWPAQSPSQIAAKAILSFLN